MFTCSEGPISRLMVTALFCFVAIAISPTSGYGGRCLFVSSYHKGYDWSDGVEKGLREVLAGNCELQQFDMDSKRHKDEASIRNAAERARQLITDWKPDVVITADDNAAKYLIAPFFRDHSLPFVFCGINWSVEEYGLPYSNATGMVEVAPIQPMLEKAKELLNRLDSAYYIGAETLTERKNLSRINRVAERMGISIEHRLVESTTQWVKAYRDAQYSDLIIIGSSAGIKDWAPESAAEAVEKIATTLSVTNHGWMMPVTMLGFTKVPQEQGAWAGKVALSILKGKNPAAVPVISNRKWDLWMNERLLQAAGIKLPSTLLKKLKKVSH